MIEYYIKDIILHMTVLVFNIMFKLEASPEGKYRVCDDAIIETQLDKVV